MNSKCLLRLLEMFKVSDKCFLSTEPVNLHFSTLPTVYIVLARSRDKIVFYIFFMILFWNSSVGLFKHSYSNTTIHFIFISSSDRPKSGLFKNLEFRSFFAHAQPREVPEWPLPVTTSSSALWMNAACAWNLSHSCQSRAQERGKWFWLVITNSYSPSFMTMWLKHLV